MKTLEELLEESKQIQTMAANLSGEISEMIHAKEEHGKDVDFASILRTAERHPITPHPLDDGRYSTEIEGYLTLLLSVAAHSTSSETQDNPLVYPCRIATALKLAPDMELLFKRSLVLDERAVNEAIAAVEEGKLVDFFVLDALRMIELYDRGNLQKLEYVSDLAALMNVSRARMEELLTILHVWMQEEKQFYCIFSEIEFTPFVPYLSVKDYAVRTPSEILVVNDGGLREDGMWNILNFAPIRNLKTVLFLNVHFHGRATSKSMKFLNIDALIIRCCSFENYSDIIFNVENCQSFWIQSSQFERCTRIMDSWDYVGVIGNLKNVGILQVNSCAFKNCFLLRELSGGYTERIGGRLFVGVKGNEINDCRCDDSNPIC